MHNFHEENTLRITYKQFITRFQANSEIKDCFGRQYFIANDNKTHLQCIFKQYIIQDNYQKQAVFENLDNFQKLADIKSVCKLLGYCLKSQSEVLAAFEFHDLPLRSYLQVRPQHRQEVYLFLMDQLLMIVNELNQLGIQLDDINKDNILLCRLGGQSIVKIFYDQKDKEYNHLFESNQLKLYWSPQKIQTQVFKGEQYNTDGEESLFQIGLILLEVIYSWEVNYNPKNNLDNSMQADIPIQKKLHKHPNFYIIGSDQIKLNFKFITEAIKSILKENKNWIVKDIAECIERMISPIQERPNIESLRTFVAIIKDRLKANKKQDDCKQHKISSFDQDSSLNWFASQKDSLKYSGSQRNFNFQNKILDTQKNTKTQHNIQLNNAQHQPAKSKMDLNSQIGQQIQLIMNNQNIQQHIKLALRNLLEYVEISNRFLCKKYYNDSIYYGQVNSQNKRSGRGIYSHQYEDIYFGNWENNVLLEGTYVFKNGQTFEGVIKNGKQGIGRYRYSNKNVYEGEWKDDLKQGKGKMIYSNGDIYQGNWANGKKHGYGQYFYHSGVVFRGNYIKGKKEGKGVIIFQDGTKVQGNWKSTHLQGIGKMFHANGDFYQGEFKLSQKNGRGIYIWDTCKYDGQFKKDSLQGHAKIKYFNGEQYNGYIHNGQRDGHGVYYYENGDYFEGQWKYDKKSVGKYYFKIGDVFEGRFNSDGQICFGVMTYKNGQIYQGQFLNAMRHGVGVYKDSQGRKIMDGHWSEDSFIGQSLTTI